MNKAINKPAYQWQGTPCDVAFGYVLQEENTDKPLYWYNFECCNKQNMDDSYEPDHFVRDNGKHFSLIPAIKVTQENQSFILANHYGIGVSKLLKGGWPNHTHFSLDGEFIENDAPYYAIKEFDLEGFEHHESERNKWQKHNFPVEYERLESLRRSIQNKDWLKSAKKL